MGMVRIPRWVWSGDKGQDDPHSDRPATRWRWTRMGGLRWTALDRVLGVVVQQRRVVIGGLPM
jgi:hypothetical protein